MKKEMNRLEVITENLANNSTTGYRRAFPIHRSFDQVLQNASAEAVDFTSGALRETGNPFDFAINGEGFFAVGKDNKEYYTRNGHFTINAEGRLITDSGLNVLSARSNIPVNIPENLNTANLTIDSKGNLKVGEQVIDQLKLVSFSDPKALSRIGTTLFEKPEGVKAINTSDINVINRSLEGSNTVVFEEMANMITCMRNYETCSKILKSQDAKDAQAIQQLT